MRSASIRNGVSWLLVWAWTRLVNHQLTLAAKYVVYLPRYLGRYCSYVRAYVCMHVGR